MISRVWEVLTRPSAHLADDTLQREARLLASFMLPLVILLLGRLVWGVADDLFRLGIFQSSSLGTLMGLAIVFSSYALCRTAYYGRAVRSFILTTLVLGPLAITLAITRDSSNNAMVLFWLAPSIILRTAFYRLRGSIWFILLISALAGLTALLAGFSMSSTIGVVIFLWGMGGLMVPLQQYRKQMEEERRQQLQESEEQLVLALDAAQMGIWFWHVATNEVVWSPRVYELMGVEVGQPIDFAVYQRHIDPEDWPLVEQAIAGVMSGREPNYDIEHRVTLPNGRVRWLEAQGRLYRDATGQPNQLSGVVRDVTARKLTELQLKYSEEKFYKAFHTTSAAMTIIHTQTGRVLEANEAFYEISGLMADQVLQQDIAQMGFWHDPAQRELASELLSEHNRLRHFEMRFVHASGEVGHGLLSAELIYIEHESYFLGVMLDVTEQRQGEEILTQQAEELRVLHQTAVELTRQLDLSALLRLIIERACGLIGVERGGIFMTTADGQGIEIVATYNAEEQIFIGTRLNKGEGLAGQVLQTGHAVSVGDYKNWRHHYPDQSVAMVGRALAVPLIHAGKVMGSINIFDEEVGEFPYHIRTLLEMFAAYAAVAVRNAQLFAAEQKQRQTAETLRDIGRVVSSTIELNEVLDLALEQIERVISYDSAHFMLIDEQRNTHLVATRRYFREEEMKGTVIPLSDLPFSSQAIETGKPVVVPDTEALPQFNPSPPEARVIRAMMIIPIYTAKRPLGVLSVLSLRPYQFSEQDQFVAEQFAQQVVMAIENARLHQELKQANTSLEERVSERTAELARAKEATEAQLAQLGTLNSIIQAVSRATDLRTALHSMTQSLTQLLQASFSIVAFFNDERTELVILPRLNFPNDSTFTQMRHIPALQTILQTKQSLIIPADHAEQLGAFGRYIPDFQLEFVLLIPLLVRGQLLGVVATASRADQPPFSPADIQLGETVAAQVAGIIEQFRLLEAEYEARVSAEAANRAKSAFLASMSHELRTPLNSILGFTQVLRRSPTMLAEEQEQLAIVQTSGEHLLELINEVLDMSKIEAGRMTLQKNPFVLGRLLQNLVGMFQARAEAKGLTFRLDTADTLPSSVVADERRLIQVLINLLENALKFTSKGEIALEVSAETNPHQTILHFAVVDTGIGIETAELPLLFTRFSQTSSGRHSQQGTGLGLALSQQLVRLLGGEIGVVSELGRGSRFSFSIPVEQALLLVEEESRAERVVIGLAEGQPRYRILVVEDLYENAFLLRKVLEPLALPLEVAVNGQEGVEMWESWRPHLILMDMQMPVMDGYEATRRIKALAGDESPIIVALTASAYETERAAILANGCDDFMSKPFRTADLFAMLGKHLGLEYVYAETEEVAPPMAALTAGVLRQMPASWREQLYTATVSADQRQIGRLALEVAAEYPAVAQALHALLGRFATADLIPLLEEAADL